jgi:hypothetical protein
VVRTAGNLHDLAESFNPRPTATLLTATQPVGPYLSVLRQNKDRPSAAAGRDAGGAAHDAEIDPFERETPPLGFPGFPNQHNAGGLVLHRAEQSREQGKESYRPGARSAYHAFSAPE